MLLSQLDRLTSSLVSALSRPRNHSNDVFPYQGESSELLEERQAGRKSRTDSTGGPKLTMLQLKIAENQSPLRVLIEPPVEVLCDGKLSIEHDILEHAKMKRIIQKHDIAGRTSAIVASVKPLGLKDL